MALKGCITWMKGKHHTKEAKEKNRIAHLRENLSPETIKRMIEANKDRVLSDTHKEKISIAMKDKPKSDAHRKNLSIANKGQVSNMKGKRHNDAAKKKMSDKLKGRIAWNKGVPMSDKQKIKLSIAHLCVQKGDKHPNWRGGISFNPYAVDWTKTLRRGIRERDRYICQVCKRPQEDFVLSIHHIDYNKFNNNTDNLIALCKSCHAKTNYNRKHWTVFFTTAGLLILSALDSKSLRARLDSVTGRRKENKKRSKRKK